MKTRTKEFKYGKIIYRAPNVVDRMRIKGALGLSFSEKGADRVNDYYAMANLIEDMRSMVIEVDAKTKDGTVVNSWDQALEHEEFLAPIQEIAQELLYEVLGVDSKKKPEAEAESTSQE